MKTLRKQFWVGMTAAAGLAVTLSAHAQGVLTVTPARSLGTVAGTTATLGYTGDGSAATGATLALPSAVAYDKSGNIYIADSNNHVIREVSKSTGLISTIAGTGVAGYTGDAAAATAAQLDTPTGVAVDASGNIYIADSHNQRIREISAGIINTIAGNGTAGYLGDGAAATAAELNHPTAVAVDASGNVYIADTNNNRIRKVSSGTISTVAGDGEQGYAGDGAAATAAIVDSPTGVAVDAAGDIFIADRHNQRVREVTASNGFIVTLAGSGTPAFGGAYGGDNAAATAASLSSPTGVSVDGGGNVYIADSNNQRVRQVANGTIATVVGNGTQDPSALSSPRGVANDVSGDLALADTLNQRVQADALPTITFASTNVGIASATQAVTLANTGTASITVSGITFSGPFTVAAGGTCSATPITLAANASCTQNLEFLPTVFGAATGSVNIAGTGLVTQEVLLAGTATLGTTTLTLTSSVAAPFINNPVIFTATVAAVGTGIAAPTGTVIFYLNGTAIGSASITATTATVSLPYTFTAAGTYAISAVYSGDTNYGGSNAALSQPVGDFSFTISTAPGASASQSVKPGDTADYDLVVAPLNGPFSFPITLSATGLPPGATVTFTPQTLILGSSSATFTMAVKTAAATGLLREMDGMSGMAMAFVMLIVPISRRQRRKGRSMSPLMMLAVAFGALTALGAMSGCGTGSGFFGQSSNTYNIEVIGTATGANGATLQHVATVQLTIQ